jgi:electron transfer flavoprotein alpha subunit
MTMAHFLVFAETSDSAVTDLTLQCLAKARELAAPGDRVTCLVAGSNVTGAAGSLFTYGADDVVVADDPRLKDYLTVPYARTVTAFLAAQPCNLVLFPASTLGNDLASRVAAMLDAACVLDAVSIRAEGGSFIAARTEYDRKVATAYACQGGRAMVATLKDGVAQVQAPDTARTDEISSWAVQLSAADLRSKIGRRDVAKKSVNLKDARIIVGVGAGIGSKDNFARVQELASALGAQLGATRAIVDAGWLPADHQIGQTGATVRPELYVACGVSGAVQHWVGISDAKTIVAINTDKGAPIMKHAHYRITADVNAVVPKLLKLMQ